MAPVLLGAWNRGLFGAFMAIGFYIPSKLLDLPDLTGEGSFALGGAVAATLIQNSGWNGTTASLLLYWQVRDAVL